MQRAVNVATLIPQCFALPGAPSPAPVGLPVRVLLGASRGMEQCPVAPEQRPVVAEDIRRWWESTPALVRADPDVLEGFWTAPVEVQCCPVFVQKFSESWVGVQ